MRFLFYLILLFFAISQNVFLQNRYTSNSEKAIKLYEKGIELYNQFNNEKAIEKLKSAIEADNQFIEAYLTLADIFHASKDFKNEIKYYKEGLEIKPEFYPNGYLNLGKVEFQTGKYSDAKEHLEKFLSFRDIPGMDEIETVELLASCNFAIHALENPVPFEPVNLGPNINTQFDEYWPTLTVDENTLIFTSLIPRDEANINDITKYHEDFFESNFENGTWAKANKLGDKINTLGNEGAQSILSDGKMMFFTACNRKGGMGRCDIYFSVKENDDWSKPMNIGRPVNSGAWESQPSISPDGRVLYFVSNREGGKGGMDIWKSTLDNNGYWGVPVNLGDSVNTIKDEASPYIHVDNETLYFSSNGWIGMGGQDLYYVKKKGENTFSHPVNLGYPINTWNDEKGLIVNAKGNKAYFSSNRLSNSGEDIYEFELYPEARPVPVSYVKGTVYDAITKVKLSAGFELIDLVTAEIIMKSTSYATGEFILCLPSDKDYALNVSKEGYLFYSGNFSLEGVRKYIDPFEIDIPLYPIMVGKKIILRNIFFETDSYELLDESKVELNKLVDFMKKNPSVIAEISGHTDNIGTNEDNQILSENRAEAVANYLAKHNIDPKRLSTKGYGESRPVDTNENEEGRAQNRRTEFTIIGN